MKSTNRVVPLYQRVQPTNAEFISEMSTKTKTTKSEFLDTVIGYFRKNYGVTEIKGIIGYGTKTGNKVQSQGR